MVGDKEIALTSHLIIQRQRKGRSLLIEDWSLDEIETLHDFYLLIHKIVVDVEITGDKIINVSLYEERKEHTHTSFRQVMEIYKE